MRQRYKAWEAENSRRAFKRLAETRGTQPILLEAVFGIGPAKSSLDFFEIFVK